MTADEVKQLLQLSPLEPEGGFFRETYRSRWQIAAEHLPPGVQGARSLGTAIYYMVTRESFSPLHRLPGTEIFHFYLGDPVVMLQLRRRGDRIRNPGAELGERPCAPSGGPWGSMAGLPAG